MKLSTLNTALRGIADSPHDRYADLNRIAETVVYLLTVVIERHYLEGDFLADSLRLSSSLSRIRADVSALVQLGFSGRVDSCAERIDIEKAFVFERSYVFAE